MKSNQRHPVAVLGLPLDSLTAAEAVEAIEDLILSGGTHQVAAANLDFWLNSISDSHLHRIVAGCSLVLADGMPLVWASGLLGCPLAERVTGADVTPLVAALSARKGYRIFLLGNMAERAADRLQRTYPGVNIAGIFAPVGEDLALLDHEEILSRIHTARPDILLVGFGNSKQEKWIWMHRKRLGVPVSMGVGNTFEVLAGETRRGPLWARQTGLEWLWHCLQDPSNLAPRYLREFLGLARRLPMALLAAWMQRPCLGDAGVTSEETPDAIHIHLRGRLTANSAQALLAPVQACIAKGQVAVVHLKQVKQISAAGLGLLLQARRRLLDEGLTLSLADLSLKTRFLLYAWCIQPLFDEWQPVSARGRSMARYTETSGNLSGKPEVLPVETHSRG